MSETARAGEWVFGVAALDQTDQLAAVLRRITGMALALEGEEPVISDLVTRLGAAEDELAALLPTDLRPRLGTDCRPDQRVYLDHGRHIGSYNPCFPEYSIHVDGPRAHGTVCFPLAYEGPPGIVHGGFLGLLFDCVVQHHNCDVGVAGKTSSMTVSYRRPTPLLRDLDFEIERSTNDRRIKSNVRLSLEGKDLATAVVEAAAGDRSQLPAVSPRRDPA
jgi:hypothetical protein